MSIGTIFDEVSSSVGKWNVEHKKESIYTLGFLNTFWGLIFFILIVLYKGEFIFSMKSLALLAVLIILDIAQTYSSLRATVEADRSTFAFIMVGTIPLLLVVDTVLGYDISLLNLVGVSIIILGLLVLFINHGLNKKGLGYVIFSTLNSVITISIYKHLITNYNSVEAQGVITLFIVVTYLFIMAKWKAKENPFKFLFRREFFLQSLFRGFSALLISFAYLFAPASFIAGGRRGVSVIAGIISGNIFFNEKHIVLKVISFVFVGFGLAFLVI